MPADLEVYNDSGVFLLSSSHAPIRLKAKNSFSVAAKGNSLIDRTRVTVPFSLNGSFIGLHCSTAHAGYIYRSHTSTSITLDLLTEPNSGTNVVSIYTFEPSMVGVSRDNFGLELFNESGELTFTSSTQNVTAYAYTSDDTSVISLPSRGETVVVLPLNPIVIRSFHDQFSAWHVMLAKTSSNSVNLKQGQFRSIPAGFPGWTLLHAQKSYALILKVFS